MPLGIERINSRRKQPNERINFIKPLEGPNRATSEDFLERIAAIVNPIMKKHQIAVMSLEEHESNPEFLGRNFNAGEVIQLVLKTTTGRWMPFKLVQMVMIHELSHCKEMNHSKAFWRTRNDYASELEVLWTQQYTGEGLWSRGMKLADGQCAKNSLDVGEYLPEKICGGTYQSSGRRKRKIKRTVSHKERQVRRIVEKFGSNGHPLGSNEETKTRLENGKNVTAKPRVARSIRGRELRAAAALARFEVKEDELAANCNDPGTRGETGSDDDYDLTVTTELNQALDTDGKKLLDGEGNCLFKVCENEVKDDIDAQNEMCRIQDIDGYQQERLLAAKSTLAAVSQQKPGMNMAMCAWMERPETSHDTPPQLP